MNDCPGNALRPWIMLAAALCLTGPLAAQPAAAPRDAAEPTAGEAEKLRAQRLMPAPLDTIESNLRDLEENGLLTVVSGRQKFINDGQDQAIVWTIRANRLLTCRYIMMQIEDFSDVRFYKTLGKDRNTPSLHEVHSKLLYYSPSLEDRAAGSGLFARDDTFQVWIYLDPVEARKIRSLQADQAVFRAPRRRPR